MPARILRAMLLLLAVSIFLGAALLFGADAWVRRVAAASCHHSPTALPPAQVALVLGCAPSVHGMPNLFFTHRISAAAELYRSGHVSAFIVSGDNGSHKYDEPTAMKDALAARGIPADRIFCDYAGFRTLDSVLRARTIFGQQRLIIVSQRFHNERAVFLARRHGMEAAGFNAHDVTAGAGLLVHLREYMARVKAVLDVTVLQTRPKFGGPPVAINLPDRT